jgi:putative transcriptional regulator
VSEILDIAHEMAQDLFKVGAMVEITMRRIDALCLPTKLPLPAGGYPAHPHG